MSSMPPRELHLLLVGKTGGGKSATGNSILGRDAFEESEGGESFTATVSEAWAERRNLEVKVVDGPGMIDTKLSASEDAKQAAENFEKAILLSQQGFNALLLVRKFGERFDKGDNESIELLKSLFGEDVVQKFCICVITNGATFQRLRKRQKSDQTFMDWCKEQSGNLGDLLRECEYRCVLLENLTEDPKVEESQMSELFQLVERIGCRYTNDLFEKAEKERERIAEKAKALQLKAPIYKKTSLLLDALNQMQKPMDFVQTEKEMERLKLKTEQLLRVIAREDEGRDLLDSIKNTVTPITDTVNDYGVKFQQLKGGKITKEEMEREQKSLREKMKEHEKKVQETQKKGIDWLKIWQVFLVVAGAVLEIILLIKKVR